MELFLKNKQVVISGGTRGIGLAVVKAFLGEGATVHFIARNAIQGLQESLNNEFKTPCFFYACDVTDENAVMQLHTQILQNSNNRIDAVIANAGSGRGQSGTITAADEWNRMWNLNFNSALFLARVFESSLKNSKGSLTFISSIAGIDYLGAPTDYSVAKSALIALAKNLSHKMAPEVRVNCIAPGNIFFEGGTWELKIKEDKARVQKMLEEKVPLQKLGTPEDISNMVLYLSSEKASFITGSCMVIDGGQTTGLH